MTDETTRDDNVIETKPVPTPTGPQGEIPDHFNDGVPSKPLVDPAADVKPAKDDESQPETDKKPGLPQYQCHKIVQAAKIRAIATYPVGSALLHLENCIPPYHVDAGFMSKHCPEVGGYLVIYEDGYKSFSPGDTFEAGYDPI